MTDLILKGLSETLLMVSVSTMCAIILGMPLAILLTVTNAQGLRPHQATHRLLGLAINATRSIPYIILTVLIMPMTRGLVGSSIGTMAAVVPLSLAGALLVARQAEEGLRNVPRGLIEVGLAAGATRWQILRDIYLQESMPSLVASLTTIIINIIGFSAMAGAVGGGGLGDLAIRYGYQRYDIQLLMVIVLLLVLMVQLVQWVGDYLVKRFTK